MDITRSNALDILASVVSSVQQAASSKKSSPEHRVSCHRCGNIRKRKLLCPRQSCPHIFCGRCADKMKEEHGQDVFIDGCPVCKELCCCSNKTIMCDRQNHCYRKCPATKGKNFPKEEPPREDNVPEHDAPALEILAQVVSYPEDGNGDPSIKKQKDRSPKRKVSAIDGVPGGSPRPAKFAERDVVVGHIPPSFDHTGSTILNPQGAHPSGAIHPTTNGWAMDGIGSISSAGSLPLNAAGSSMLSTQGKHPMVIPPPNLLALRTAASSAMKNPGEQTMLLLGSSIPDEQSTPSYVAVANAIQQGAVASSSHLPPHYDISYLPSAAWNPTHGGNAVPPSGTALPLQYILPKDEGVIRDVTKGLNGAVSPSLPPSVPSVPFHGHPSGVPQMGIDAAGTGRAAYSLSPRTVSSANTPTTLYTKPHSNSIRPPHQTVSSSSTLTDRFSFSNGGVSGGAGSGGLNGGNAGGNLSDASLLLGVAAKSLSNLGNTNVLNGISGPAMVPPTSSTVSDVPPNES